MPFLTKQGLNSHQLDQLWDAQMTLRDRAEEIEQFLRDDYCLQNVLNALDKLCKEPLTWQD